MALPVSLSRVLNEINLVKKEVESNKQILFTILSTLRTFKDDSHRLNAVLSTKIEGVDGKVNSVRTAVNQIIGPSEDLDTDNCVNGSFGATKNYTYDSYEATTNSGESESIPNRISTSIFQLSVDNDSIKAEEIKEEPLDETSLRDCRVNVQNISYNIREEFYDEEQNACFYQVDDLSLQNQDLTKYGFDQRSSKSQLTDKRITNADLMSASADISSVDADFLAEFPKKVSKRIKKCRDGCPNCEKEPCRKCKNCRSKRRCKLKECSEYNKTKKALNVKSTCPNCKKSFSQHTNLVRHVRLKSCAGVSEYEGRYISNMKYQNLMVRCFEVDCPKPIFTDYTIFALHRTESGHKNWRYRCAVCHKWIHSHKMKSHLDTHNGKTADLRKNPQISADTSENQQLSADKRDDELMSADNSEDVLISADLPEDGQISADLTEYGQTSDDLSDHMDLDHVIL